jgi:hypothetical protein
MRLLFILCLIQYFTGIKFSKFQCQIQTKKSVPTPDATLFSFVSSQLYLALENHKHFVGQEETAEDVK